MSDRHPHQVGCMLAVLVAASLLLGVLAFGLVRFMAGWR